MNEATIVTYENQLGKLTFSYDSAFWVTDIDGASSVEVDIAETRSFGQVGSSMTNQSIKPRSIPVDGAIFEPLAINRQKLLHIIAPLVPSVFTVIENGESWYLLAWPKKTPVFSDGNGVQHFQMELYAPYPLWRTTESYSEQIAGLVKMFKTPFYTGGQWWISKFSNDYFKTIINKGNSPIEFRVIFTARSELKNPELFHMGTRKSIRFRKTVMTAGEQLIVSTINGMQGVVALSSDGVASNGFSKLAIGCELDMTLEPGYNQLRIDAEVNREGLAAHIQVPKGVKSGV